MKMGAVQVDGPRRENAFQGLSGQLLHRGSSDPFLGSKGGFIGLDQFGPHMAKRNDSTIDDYVDDIDYVISLVGEDFGGDQVRRL